MLWWADTPIRSSHGFHFISIQPPFHDPPPPAAHSMKSDAYKLLTKPNKDIFRIEQHFGTEQTKSTKFQIQQLLQNDFVFEMLRIPAEMGFCEILGAKKKTLP